MKQEQEIKNYRFDQYWYLGFLGFIGLYFIPEFCRIIQGNSSAWSLTNLLWFLWFLYFIPEEK